jgi:hypothetical protein
MLKIQLKDKEVAWKPGMTIPDLHEYNQVLFTASGEELDMMITTMEEYNTLKEDPDAFKNKS